MICRRTTHGAHGNREFTTHVHDDDDVTDDGKPLDGGVVVMATVGGRDNS